MNYRLVFRAVGMMVLLLAVAMALSLVLGYALTPEAGRNSEGTSLKGWEISVSVTLIFGALLFFLGRPVGDQSILRKDAMGIVGIGWIVCSVFASLPYFFCDPGLKWAEALFEGVSGLTTTGATVFSDLAPVPKTVLLWRSMTQWLGGMGIIAMFVLISASLGGSGKNLFKNESSISANEILGASMRRTVRWLWGLYVSLTVICFSGLLFSDMSLFQAINHSLTTVATGGFGTENTSIDGFGLFTRSWIIAFMFLCGISFPLHLALVVKKDWKLLKTYEEAWVFALLVLVAGLAIFGLRSSHGDVSDPVVEEVVGTVFNVVAISTGTGYAVGDYDAWPVLAKGALLVLMVIGGCTGSTSGGLKVGRMIMLVKVLHGEVLKAFRPNLVLRFRLNGRDHPSGENGRLLALLGAAVLSGVLGSFLFIALEPDRSTFGCVSAVVSCLSNTGPAFAEFGPTQNYAGLGAPTMVLSAFLMVLGRLEYISLLVLFSWRLWKPF
ncbi:MAG: TrkH family potassium uptake protein [Verrucomicrobiota bacterium]